MENNPESRPLENVGQPPTAVFPSPVDNSNQPLLQAEGMGSNDVSVSFGDNPSFQDASGVAQEEVDQRFAGSESMITRARLCVAVPMIGCRVCGAQIPYDSNSMQHVVRCISCNEATPIRSAPSGKKFVRCPCNCLLICKVSSNRIACPRASCGRVIILQPPASNGPTVPAPAGTARVQCYYCEEVFMFNTLTSCIAPCPHCQKRSVPRSLDPLLFQLLRRPQLRPRPFLRILRRRTVLAADHDMHHCKWRLLGVVAFRLARRPTSPARSSSSFCGWRWPQLRVFLSTGFTTL